MPRKIKEKGTKQPELQQVIDALNNYRQMLFENPSVASNRFHNMQKAIHGCKNIVRDLYGAKRKSEIAWIK